MIPARKLKLSIITVLAVSLIATAFIWNAKTFSNGAEVRLEHQLDLEIRNPLSDLLRSWSGTEKDNGKIDQNKTSDIARVVSEPEEKQHDILWSKVTKATKDRKFKKKKVYFLKMHKSASSTVASILSYWGLRNNLTFALPKKLHQFWPHKFVRSKMMSLGGREPDIFMSHVIDSDSIDELMPRHETVYFTAVREPVTLLESAFNYFATGQCTGYDFNTFFQKGHHIRQPGIKHCEFTDYLHNIMAFDLGLTPNDSDNASRVHDLIQRADKRFDLVLLTERLDECLILLRDLIGATTEDIAVLKNNFRKSEAKSPIMAETREIIESWNWADKIIYEHFKNKTEALLEEKREYIQAELIKLKTARSLIQQLCIAGESEKSGLAKGMKVYGRGTLGYVLTEEGRNNSMCVMKSSPETTIVGMIRQKMAALQTV